jgi:hypothetical protein
LRVSSQWIDGIDFAFAENTDISLEFNDNTAMAAKLVNIDGERCTVNQLPVRLRRSTG